jgi:hypothetical protein
MRPSKPSGPALGLSVAVACALTATAGLAQGSEQEGIGVITSVQGAVTLDHPDPADAFQVKAQEPLLAQDVIETRGESRTKALFHNESLLTIGQNSRVEILEHAQDQGQDQRRMKVKLVRGSLRALIGSAFSASGATFEVRTPSAVATTRSGYLVAWVEGETSGVANIGQSGSVEFTAGGQTKRLEPNHYTVSKAGGAPLEPAVLSPDAHPGVLSAVAGTHLRESHKHGAPKRAIDEFGAPRAIGLGLGGVGGAEGSGGPGGSGSKSGDQSAGVDEAQGGGNSPDNQSKQEPPETHHHQGNVPSTTSTLRTPHSVISGSANNLLRERGLDRVRH